MRKPRARLLCKNKEQQLHSCTWTEPLLRARTCARGRGSTHAGKTPPRGHRPRNYIRNPVLPQMQACSVWRVLPKCPGSESCVTLGKNRFTEGLPWQCSGHDPVLPMQGMWVWSLAGEPGSHMLGGAGGRGQGGGENRVTVTLTTQQVGVTLLWKPQQYFRWQGNRRWAWAERAESTGLIVSRDMSLTWVWLIQFRERPKKNWKQGAELTRTSVSV